MSDFLISGVPTIASGRHSDVSSSLEAIRNTLASIGSLCHGNTVNTVSLMWMNIADNYFSEIINSLSMFMFNECNNLKRGDYSFLDSPNSFEESVILMNMAESECRFHRVVGYFLVDPSKVEFGWKLFGFYGDNMEEKHLGTYSFCVNKDKDDAGLDLLKRIIDMCSSEHGTNLNRYAIIRVFIRSVFYCESSIRSLANFVVTGGSGKS